MVSCCALAQGQPEQAQTANAPSASSPGASEPQPAPREQPKPPSPWLFTPVFNSSPKLGIAVGATVGYLHRFDQKSRPSIFATTGQYTNTGSLVAGAFARTSFDEDHQRLNAGITYGNIKNDYNDYLGTGVPLRNDATLKSFIARYLYRVYGDWFVGVQGIYQNFAIEGDTAFDDLVLAILGVAPYKSGDSAWSATTTRGTATSGPPGAGSSA
jgi:hypothetical protein